ncbi:MAG: HAD family hydrolase [Bacteroidia bacterium]|jgi:phosphoglycolate phosphatase-like HAD superfamily hydrolase
MYFFLDFDGTLIDVSEKYYRTYLDILTDDNQRSLDKYLYWELKRSKMPEKLIHQISGAVVPDFSNKRKRIIETDSYQKFDVLIPGADETLRTLSGKGKLILVTLRHSHEHVLKQLKNLGIHDYFEAILSSGNEEEPKWKIKQEMIQRYFNQILPEESVLIGDTETDILAGKAFNFKTVGVLSGMRNYDYLSKVNPDVILPSFHHFNA